MSEDRIKTYYLSEKVSKIRWVPQKLMESTRFLTGSWNMPKNSVKIWNFQESIPSEKNEKLRPQCNDEISFAGDITGMEFIATNVVAVSCSDGRVSIIQIKPSIEKDKLELQAQSKILHGTDKEGNETMPCTGISVYANQIATVGEDGCLNIIEANASLKELLTIQADSCALTCVVYVNPQEVLTASNMGIIRMFDVRDTSSTKKECTSAFMTSIEDDRRSNYISCLVYHPTQPHIILAGAEEGSITVWDLRQPGYPASYLSAHESAINEMAFHRSDPTKFFSAADNGELWQWTEQQPLIGYPGIQNDEHMNPWLNGERAKSRLNVTSIISNLRKSINCFDINDSKLICGSDTEAIYYIKNLL